MDTKRPQGREEQTCTIALRCDYWVKSGGEKWIMLRLMPEVVGASIRPTRLLPEQIGTLANDLVQTRFGLRQHAMRISVRGQLAAAANMHLGVQTLEFLVRDQFRVARRLSLLERFLLHSRGADRDRKRVQNLGALFLNIN